LHTEGVKVSALQPRGIRTLNQASRNLVLLIIDGPKKGLRVVIPPGESMVIGRTSAAKVACEDDYMSSKHFEVCNRSLDFFVKDLNSRNGTKVSDETISERALTQTSRITAGKSIFELAWESNLEDWGTQGGSSMAIRRSSSSFLPGSNPQSLPHADSSHGSSPGSQPHFDSRGSSTNFSVNSSLEERTTALCLDLFHASVNPRRDVRASAFERLYNWTKTPQSGESFLSDFYLTHLDFFAIASFSKLGVENPANIAWYPLFPAVDPASATSPIAIPKRAWLENCHIRWFDRLCSVDGISFIITASSTSPDWILNQLNRGFRELFVQTTREETVPGGLGSGEGGTGQLPWYSPMELLAAIGTRTEETLGAWIPAPVQGIVFPIKVSRLSFAFVRSEIAGSLRERGFCSANQ
jgi:pSer/pThr/pTyr-binding forkhead associated (FHA) protein